MQRSRHVRGFRQFLNVANRSLFESASMLFVFETMQLWLTGNVDHFFSECDELNRYLQG